MDLVAVNKDPELRHNPWGVMTLSRANPHEPVGYSDEYRVDITHPVTGKKSLLGITQVGQAPWNLVCGNRPYEYEHAMKNYRARKAEIEREHNSKRADHRKDFVAGLRKFVQRAPEGRHDLAVLLAGRR